MSRLGRFASAVALATLAVPLLAAGPSYAARGGPHPAFDGGADPGGGIPGWFVGLFFLMFAVGIGLTVWKVTTAQRLAKQGGLDPGLATQVALLTDNGLDATYLASSLRQPDLTAPAATPAAPGPARDVSARLAELKGLLDQGAVTQAEYDARRQAIIDSV
jgi:hypothetical protein